jgi:hypothetical protein
MFLEPNRDWNALVSHIISATTLPIFKCWKTSAPLLLLGRGNFLRNLGRSARGRGDARSNFALTIGSHATGPGGGAPAGDEAAGLYPAGAAALELDMSCYGNEVTLARGVAM